MSTAASSTTTSRLQPDFWAASTVSDVPADILEAFLTPLLSDWNRMAKGELERLDQCAFGRDPAVTVRYEGVEQSPFYECLVFSFEKPDAFRLIFQVEGRIGGLSFQTHHPVLRISGDTTAGKTWLYAAISHGAR